jgi:hypothetical protein
MMALGTPVWSRWSLAMGLLTALCVLHPAPARADGGTLRYAKRYGHVEISVFTDPTPVRTGSTVDVSILVEPVSPGRRTPLPAFQVCAYPQNDPKNRQCQPAAEGVAINKLFRATQLELTEPGTWQIEIQAETEDGQIVLGFPVEVEYGFPHWATYGALIGLPGAAILIYIVHQRLVRRRQRLAKQLAAPVPAKT